MLFRIFENVNDGVYHESYSSAVQYARTQAESRGYEITDDEWFNVVNTGPAKPSPGEHNSLHLELHKDGKLKKENLHIIVTNIDNNARTIKTPYELVFYIS